MKRNTLSRLVISAPSSIAILAASAQGPFAQQQVSLCLKEQKHLSYLSARRTLNASSSTKKGTGCTERCSRTKIRTSAY